MFGPVTHCFAGVPVTKVEDSVPVKNQQRPLLSATDENLRDKTTLKRGANRSVKVYSRNGNVTHTKYRVARKDARPLRKNCEPEMRLKRQI